MSARVITKKRQCDFNNRVFTSTIGKQRELGLQYKYTQMIKQWILMHTSDKIATKDTKQWILMHTSDKIATKDTQNGTIGTYSE